MIALKNLSQRHCISIVYGLLNIFLTNLYSLTIQQVIPILKTMHNGINRRKKGTQ